MVSTLVSKTERKGSSPFGRTTQIIDLKLKIMKDTTLIEI